MKLSTRAIYSFGFARLCKYDELGELTVVGGGGGRQLPPSCFPDGE